MGGNQRESGDSWKDQFPGAGTAQVVTQRLARIVAKIESHDFDGAQMSLRNWQGSLDFTGVPKAVQDETERLLNDALSFMKPTGREIDLAIDRLRRAMELW